MSHPIDESPATQDLADADTAERYGRTVGSQYGGTFLEGTSLVVLFTEDLDRHANALRPRLEHPGRLEVRRADRPLTSVEQARDVLSRRFAGDSTYGITSIGVGLADGQFVVVIGIEPYTNERADEVAAAAAPYLVRVIHRGRPRRLRA